MDMKKLLLQCIFHIMVLHMASKVSAANTCHMGFVDPIGDYLLAQLESGQAPLFTHVNLSISSIQSCPYYCVHSNINKVKSYLFGAIDNSGFCYCTDVQTAAINEALCTSMMNTTTPVLRYIKTSGVLANVSVAGPSFGEANVPISFIFTLGAGNSGTNIQYKVDSYDSTQIYSAWSTSNTASVTLERAGHYVLAVRVKSNESAEIKHLFRVTAIERDIRGVVQSYEPLVFQAGVSSMFTFRIFSFGTTNVTLSRNYKDGALVGNPIELRMSSVSLQTVYRSIDDIGSLAQYSSTSAPEGLMLFVDQIFTQPCYLTKVDMHVFSSGVFKVVVYRPKCSDSFCISSWSCASSCSETSSLMCPSTPTNNANDFRCPQHAQRDSTGLDFDLVAEFYANSDVSSGVISVPINGHGFKAEVGDVIGVVTYTGELGIARGDSPTENFMFFSSTGSTSLLAGSSLASYTGIFRSHISCPAEFEVEDTYPTPGVLQVTAVCDNGITTKNVRLDIPVQDEIIPQSIVLPGPIVAPYASLPYGGIATGTNISYWWQFTLNGVPDTLTLGEQTYQYISADEGWINVTLHMRNLLGEKILRDSVECVAKIESVNLVRNTELNYFQVEEGTLQQFHLNITGGSRVTVTMHYGDDTSPDEVYIHSTGVGSYSQIMNHTYQSCATGQLCYSVTNHVGENFTDICLPLRVICRIDGATVVTFPTIASDGRVYVEQGKRLSIEVGLAHGSNVTYSCRKNATGVQTASQALDLFPSPLFFYFDMHEKDNFTFFINGSNPISTFNFTILVVVTNCPIPVINVIGSIQAFSPSYFTMGQLVKIMATVVPPDDNCGDFGCSYAWNIMKNDSSNSFNNINTISQGNKLGNINFTAGSLQHGDYMMELNQTCTSPTLLSVAQTVYVKLIESDIVCTINGGSTIAKPLKISLQNGSEIYYDIKLDARYSYDPDDQHRNISLLTFTWECRRLTNDSIADDIKLARETDTGLSTAGDTCYGNTWNLITNNVIENGLVVFDSSLFLSEVEYEFRLVVTKGTRSCSYNQEIEFITGIPPVKAVGTSNSNNGVNFQQSAIIDITCELCGKKKFECHFSLLDENGFIHSKDQDPSIAPYGWDSCGCVISAYGLQALSKYILKAEAWYIGGTRRSETTFELQTYSQPTGLQCFMDPIEGITMAVKFKMMFRGADSPDVPLTYGAEYNMTQDGNGQEIANPKTVKWYYGAEQDTPLYNLPAGTFKFIGYVVSSKGVRAHCPPVDIVVSPAPPGSVDLEDLQNSVPDPADTGAMASFVQGVSSAVKPPPPVPGVIIIPEQEKQQQNIGAPPLDEEKEAAILEETKELVKNTLQALEKTDVKNLDEFAAVSSAYGSITNDPTIVNEDAKKSAVNGIQNACSHLELMVASGDFGAEAIESACSDATLAISNLIKSNSESAKTATASMNSSSVGGSSPALDEMQEQSNKLMDAISNLGKAIQLPVGQPVSLSSNSFDLVVAKFNIQDLSNVTVNSTGAEYGLPDDLGVTSTSFAKVAAVTMKEDVFLTDTKALSNMGSPTCTLGLTDDNGSPIKVQNLSEPIRLSIFNDASKLKPRTVNLSFPGEMKVERIAIENPDQPLLVRIELLNDYEADAIVYLRYNQAPTFEDWDFRIEVTPTSSNVQEQVTSTGLLTDDDLIYRMIDSSSIMIVDFNRLPNANLPDIINGTMNATLFAGVTYNGTTPDPIAVSNIFTADLIMIENAVNITMTTYSPSCLYWNNDTKLWDSDGLEMGYNETDFNITVCYSNHLTSFGGFQVKPEPIPALSLDMLKNGFVLLLTVLLILLLYLVALIYTRRSDKRDIDKVGVCPLADNNPCHQFSYEITVFTGMRRNAGTKSKVFFIAGGEAGESKVRYLEDPKRKTFTKNSSDSFVFTNETDLGDLTHLRIWHDNSDGGWYLRNVTITDLQRDKKFNFLCSRWLAVGEDDGQIERFLPVSGPEELSDFSYVFSTKARQDLHDAHLWFSIYARPPCSSFTRTQRMSCCLSLLMTTMMASAMFYRVMPKSTPASENDINGIKFTWAQVYVSIITTLITVPINVLIITIFRMARPKAFPEDKQPEIATGGQAPRQNDDVVNQDFIEVSVDQDGETKAAKKKDKKPMTLPHWTIYIAWALVFISVMSSSVMVVIYGMIFGNKTSLDWLSSLFISFSQDVIVTQPIKVFLLAIFVAAILKRIDDVHSMTMGNRGKKLASNEQWLHGSADPTKVGVDLEISKVKPPQGEKLAQMRELRLKEKKMYSITREILTYSFFVFIAMSVSYSLREEIAYYQTADLNELFQLKNKDPSNHELTHFKKVYSYHDVWPFLDQFLIDIVFPIPWYNDTGITPQAATFPGKLYIGDINSKLVNGVRLRQIRLKPDTCIKTEYGLNVTDRIDCAGAYSFLDEQKSDFNYNWSKPHNFPREVKRQDSAWRYQDWAALDGYPFWGTLNTYFGGGYAVELFPKFPNRNIMANLKRLRWLDRHSRALFVEFAIFNAASNHFSMITMLFEFPPTGGVVHYASVLTFKLYRATAGFAFFTIVCEVLFIFFIIYFGVREIKRIKKQGMSYFKGFWNVIEIAIIVLSIMAIGFYIYRTYLASQLLDKLPEKKPDRFINFQFASYWNSVFIIIVALIVFFVSIKFMKLLRFNRRISVLQSTLEYALAPLGVFSFIMFIVIFGTCLFSNIVFGSHLEGYSDLFKTTASQMSLLLGKFSYVEYEQTNRILGPIFFLLFNVIINWILVNMLISVVNDSFEVVCNNAKEQSNEYEMVDFIMDRFKGFVGVGTRRQEEMVEDINWKKDDSMIFDSALAEDDESTTGENYPQDIISEKHAERWKYAEMSSLAADDYMKETEIDKMISGLSQCISTLGIKERDTTKAVTE